MLLSDWLRAGHLTGYCPLIGRSVLRMLDTTYLGKLLLCRILVSKDWTLTVRANIETLHYTLYTLAELYSSFVETFDAFDIKI